MRRVNGFAVASQLPPQSIHQRILKHVAVVHPQPIPALPPQSIHQRILKQVELQPQDRILQLPPQSIHQRILKPPGASATMNGCPCLPPQSIHQRILKHGNKHTQKWMFSYSSTPIDPSEDTETSRDLLTCLINDNFHPNRSIRGY